MNRLAEALHSSELVIYDEERGLVYDWNGAHTVNIYDEEANPIDCFTWGHDRDDISVHEAREQIQIHIDQQNT